jgi:hypothetical protein
MFLPILTGVMGEIEIPDLQGFILDVQSVQGDVRRANTDTFEFMTIYAQLGFSPPPPPAARTRVRLREAGTSAVELEILDPDQEVQYRVDRGVWSPFRRGPAVRIPKPVLPGRYELQVRARIIGDYRSLDPEPASLAFDVDPPERVVATGCGTAPGHGLPLAVLALMCLALLVRRSSP